MHSNHAIEPAVRGPLRTALIATLEQRVLLAWHRPWSPLLSVTTCERRHAGVVPSTASDMR